MNNPLTGRRPPLSRDLKQGAGVRLSMDGAALKAEAPYGQEEKRVVVMIRRMQIAKASLRVAGDAHRRALSPKCCGHRAGVASGHRPSLIDTLTVLACFIGIGLAVGIRVMEIY